MRLIIGQKLNCNVSVFLMVMQCLLFFFFCVVTVLTVPQCPPLTGTWPAPQMQNDRIYSPERASLINLYFHSVVVIKLFVFSVSAPT